MDMIQIYENSATVVLIILISAHRTSGIYSRCEAGSVNEGEPANITCHFDKDIRRNLLDVNVNRFEPKPVTIFTCAWFGADPDIIAAPGVTYDADISNKLTLRIINVSKETFGGSYMCQVAKSLQYESVPCTLNVSGKYPNSTQTTNMISKEMEISSSTGREKGTDAPLGPVIGGVFGALVTVVAVSGLVVLCLWRRNKARKRNDGIGVHCDYKNRSTTYTQVQKNNHY